MTSVQAAATLVAEHAYIFCFGASWGPVIWVLFGEMFPNRIRGSAIAVAAGTLWVTNCAVTTTFPILLKLIGLGGVFCLYAAAALASLWIVQHFLPETKGRALEVM
jgi:SP family sugar:H+ symporter-like MFS transporter